MKGDWTHRGSVLIYVVWIVLLLCLFAAGVGMQALARSAYTLALARNRLRAYTFLSAKMVDLELAYGQGAVVPSRGQFRMGHDEFDWRVDASESSEDPQLELVTLLVDWHQGGRASTSTVSMLRDVSEGQP